MAVFSRTISHRIEFVLLRIVQMLLTVIPRRIALQLGSAAGSVLYRLGIYRRIVAINFDYIDLWKGQTRRTIIKSLYRNLGKYVVDFLRPAYPLPTYRLHDYASVEPVFNQGKGTICILGHIGNWEMLATVFGKATGKLNVVAKPMHNPLVDGWLLSKRNASGVTTIFSNQALRKMLSVLKKDGIVAILIDQFMRNHGDTVPFLGKEAKTVSTVAGLAQKTGCNVISIKAIMAPDGSYDIHPLVTNAPGDLSSLTEEKQILALQTLHNDILSRQIMEHPDHWFGWFHKRFRGIISYNRI